MLKETRLKKYMSCLWGINFPNCDFYTHSLTHTLARYDVKNQKAKVTSTKFSIYTIWLLLLLLLLRCSFTTVLYSFYIFYSYPRGGLLCGCYKQKKKRFFFVVVVIIVMVVGWDIYFIRHLKFCDTFTYYISSYKYST